MRTLEELCPQPPDWRLPWQQITEFDWIRSLHDVAQDPVHHAEGDVAVHTRMACEALAADPAWRALSVHRRRLLFVTVLMHDIAKPYRTRIEADGRITAHGHSRQGELMARRILWRLRTPVADREHIAKLIRHHQVPFWAMERTDVDRIAFAVSLSARNDDLAMLARADLTGRICGDAGEIGENIDLYSRYCAEVSCLDKPREFASDHARFEYFRTPGRDPGYAAWDDTRCTVTVLSGMPGAGKDTWIARHRSDTPVISLDALRRDLKVRPGDKQGTVVAAARQQAREHLRAGRSFVWNATNLARQTRGQVIGLAADYRARVEVVAVEAPPDQARQRNRDRAEAVPESVVNRMLKNWEAPDPTEAHSVQYVTV